MQLTLNDRDINNAVNIKILALIDQVDENLIHWNIIIKDYLLTCELK